MNIKLSGIVGKPETRYTPEGKAVLTAVSAGKVSVDVKPVKRDLSDAEIEELGAQEAESRGGK